MCDLGYGLLEDAQGYEDFPGFRQPALILHGAKDTVVPPGLSEHVCRGPSQCRLDAAGLRSSTHRRAGADVAANYSIPRIARRRVNHSVCGNYPVGSRAAAGLPLHTIVCNNLVVANLGSPVALRRAFEGKRASQKETYHENPILHVDDGTRTLRSGGQFAPDGARLQGEGGDSFRLPDRLRADARPACTPRRLR